MSIGDIWRQNPTHQKGLSRLKTITGGSTILLLLGGLVALDIADAVETRLLLDGGLAQEGNYFMIPVVNQSNYPVIKVGGVILAALLLWFIYQRFPKVATLVAKCFVIFYTVVVLWNLTLFFRG